MFNPENNRDKYFMTVIDIVIGLAIMIVVFLSVYRIFNIRL